MSVATEEITSLAEKDDSSLPADANRLLLRDVDLAQLIGCCQRHVSTLDSTGRIPQPIKFGRLVRWSRFEIIQWIEAGCPNREQWIAIKKQQKCNNIVRVN